jgi:hypothetical protein
MQNVMALALASQQAQESEQRVQALERLVQELEQVLASRQEKE